MLSSATTWPQALHITTVVLSFLCTFGWHIEFLSKKFHPNHFVSDLSIQKNVMKYSLSGFLLHFKKAEKLSTKTLMSTKILICQLKAYLRIFMKNSSYNYLNLHLLPRNYINFAQNWLNSDLSAKTFGISWHKLFVAFSQGQKSDNKNLNRVYFSTKTLSRKTLMDCINLTIIVIFIAFCGLYLVPHRVRFFCKILGTGSKITGLTGFHSGRAQKAWLFLTLVFQG